MGGGEQAGSVAAFRHAEYRCLFGTDRIHHRQHVVHATFKGRVARVAVRQAGTALVEDHDPSDGAQALEEPGGGWFLPCHLHGSG